MSRLNDDTLEALRAVDILDVADRLGMRVNARTRRASCYNTQAHAHGDRNPSLSFDKHTNRYKCFACGEQGDTIALVMAVQGASFRQACDWLASNYGIATSEHSEPLTYSSPSYHRKDPYETNLEPIRLTDMLDYDLPSADIYAELYKLSDEPDFTLRNWWQQRGYDDELLKIYGWRLITPATVRRLCETSNYADLAKAGLVSDDKGQLEQFLRRYTSHFVIVPFFDSPFNARRVMYVRFRALDNHQRAKYLAPSGTHPPIYGYDELIEWIGYMPMDKQPPLYITESETDAIAIRQLGKLKGIRAYAIALTGASKTGDSLVVRELVRALRENDTLNITVNISTDADEAGDRFYNSIAIALYKAGVAPNRLVKWQPWIELHSEIKDAGEYLQWVIKRAK